MKVPYLKKKPELKTCHNVEWEDNYSWVHQKNILEVLRNKKNYKTLSNKNIEDLIPYLCASDMYVGNDSFGSHITSQTGKKKYCYAFRIT